MADNEIYEMKPIAHIYNDFTEKFGIPRQSGLAPLPSDWSPTVRPPKLGGNKRMGVFASRSPFRPNSIGLSAVKLEKIDLEGENAPVLYVSGADLMNGTPIFDIKPYLPYADAYPEAKGGFALQNKEGLLRVEFPSELLDMIPEEKREGLTAALAQDPRPSYQNDPDRIYTFGFGGAEISFLVEGETLKVVKIS